MKCFSPRSLPPTQLPGCFTRWLGEFKSHLNAELLSGWGLACSLGGIVALMLGYPPLCWRPGGWHVKDTGVDCQLGRCMEGNGAVASADGQRAGSRPMLPSPEACRGAKGSGPPPNRALWVGLLDCWLHSFPKAKEGS